MSAARQKTIQEASERGLVYAKLAHFCRQERERAPANSHTRSVWRFKQEDAEGWVQQNAAVIEQFNAVKYRQTGSIAP